MELELYIIENKRLGEGILMEGGIWKGAYLLAVIGAMLKAPDDFLLIL